MDGSIFTECSSRSAYLASYLYPSMFTAADSSTWKIETSHDQYIELSIIDLNIPDRTKTGTYLEVFDIDRHGKRIASFGRFTEYTQPRAGVKSSWNVMEIEFRVGKNGRGRGFFGYYEAKRFQSFQEFYISINIHSSVSVAGKCYHSRNKFTLFFFLRQHQIERV